jgi:SHAQKYF class myb-like DNA-binding protein
MTLPFPLLSPTDVVPRKILMQMNVKSLSVRQIASHLQVGYLIHQKCIVS